MPAFEQAGARRVEYHPLAWDPDLHPPAQTFSEGELAPYRADVAFAGKWSPERARWLEPLAGLDLAVWGDGTWGQYLGRRSPLRARWRGRSVAGREYAMACAAAKACLNFIEPAAEGSANMRTFELAGMGCFQLALRNAAHQELFEEGREIECFATPQELRAKIERRLGDDGARRAIGLAAHRKAVAEHTYRHRAERVLELVREPVLRCGTRSTPGQTGVPARAA